MCKLTYANPWQGIFILHGIEWVGYPLDEWAQPGTLDPTKKRKLWDAINSGTFKFVKCDPARTLELTAEHDALEAEGYDFANHPLIHRYREHNTNPNSVANLKKGKQPKAQTTSAKTARASAKGKGKGKRKEMEPEPEMDWIEQGVDTPVCLHRNRGPTLIFNVRFYYRRARCPLSQPA